MKLFSQSDVLNGLKLPDYIRAVEAAHRAHGLGQIIEPDLLHAEAESGEFHIKIGGLAGEPAYFGLKANGGFFNNAEKYGLPNILGVIYICDSKNGLPLAVLDSVVISRFRTGAATAVAAKYLARADSQVQTVCGPGTQGRIQIEALLQVLPIKQVFVHGRDQARADAFAIKCAAELGINAMPAGSLADSLAVSDVLVTCTPSNEALVERDWIPPGMFVAAVGADSPGKQELAAEILAENTVVADILHQSLRVGESQHAIAAGLMTPEHIHAQLGEVICGLKPGRVDDEDIIVYDSTGTALQDVAAAALLYEKSLKDGSGTEFDLFA